MCNKEKKVAKEIMRKMAEFVNKEAKLELEYKFVQCYLNRSDAIKRMLNEVRFVYAIFDVFKGNQKIVNQLRDLDVES